VRPRRQSVQVRSSGRLTRGGEREKRGEQEAVRVSSLLIGIQFRKRHALPTSRARPQQKKAFDTVGMVKRQLLCDHAAQRKPHDIELVQSEGIAERHGMPRHLQGGAGRFAPGTCDPGIVEQDDVVIGGSQSSRFPVK
jgi:hypothetical protein